MGTGDKTHIIVKGLNAVLDGPYTKAKDADKFVMDSVDGVGIVIQKSSDGLGWSFCEGYKGVVYTTCDEKDKTQLGFVKDLKGLPQPGAVTKAKDGCSHLTFKGAKPAADDKKKPAAPKEEDDAAPSGECKFDPKTGKVSCPSAKPAPKKPEPKKKPAECTFDAATGKVSCGLILIML